MVSLSRHPKYAGIAILNNGHSTIFPSYPLSMIGGEEYNYFRSRYRFRINGIIQAPRGKECQPFNASKEENSKPFSERSYDEVEECSFGVNHDRSTTIHHQSLSIRVVENIRDWKINRPLNKISR